MLKSEGVDACAVNARFIKPLDKDLIISLARRVKKLIIVEENVLAGGFGSAILECLSDARMADVSVRRIGIDDEFVEHGFTAQTQGEVRSRRTGHIQVGTGVYEGNTKGAIAHRQVIY